MTDDLKVSILTTKKQRGNIMANTLSKFYEKLVIAFGTANKKILDRIHCEIRTNELVVTIRREKQGFCNCINASVISVVGSSGGKVFSSSSF